MDELDQHLMRDDDPPFLDILLALASLNARMDAWDQDMRDLRIELGIMRRRVDNLEDSVSS